jgi:predicted transcriptional regulator
VITAEILGACKDGARRTRVLYGVNLSFNQMNKYMKLLEGRKLVRYDGESRMYKTTQQGLSFLADSAELNAAFQKYLESKKKYSDSKKRLLDMLGEGKQRTDSKKLGSPPVGDE